MYVYKYIYIYISYAKTSLGWHGELAEREADCESRAKYLVEAQKLVMNYARLAQLAAAERKIIDRSAEKIESVS